MEEDGDENEQGRDDARYPVSADSPARIRDWEIDLGEGPAEKHEREYPGVVDTHGDAGNTEKRETRFHASLLL
jgi:hypothetical protein